MKWYLRVWEMKNGEEVSYFDSAANENEVRSILSRLERVPSVMTVWIQDEDANVFLDADEWLEQHPERSQKEDYSGSREYKDEVVVTRTWLTDEEWEKTPDAVHGCRYDLEVYVRGAYTMPGYYLTLASYWNSGEATRARWALMSAAEILPEVMPEGSCSEEDQQALRELYEVAL